MMKKIISVLLMCVLLVSSLCTYALAAGKFFYDITPDFWAYDYIMTMTEKGILAGYEDNTFRPENNVERCEFAKMLASFTENPYVWSSKKLYADVSLDAWYAPFLNVVKEYFNTKTENGQEYFMPNEDATREDVAVALVKFLGYAPFENTTSLDATFTDSNKISASAKPYIAVAVEKNLVTGYQDNTFRPHGNITRAEAATLLFRAFNFEKSNIVGEVYPDTIIETFSSFANVGISETFTEDNISYITYDEIPDANREYTVLLDYMEYLVDNNATMLPPNDSFLALYCPRYVKTTSGHLFATSLLLLIPSDTDTGYQITTGIIPVDYNGKPCTIYQYFPAIDITSVSSIKLAKISSSSNGIVHHYTYTNEDIFQVLIDFIEVNITYGDWEFSKEYEYANNYIVEMQNSRGDSIVITAPYSKNELLIELIPAK